MRFFTARNPLVHQGRDSDLPPLAQALRIRNAHIRQANLVETGISGHLPDRTNVDAGHLHIQEEIGQAFMLHGFRITERHQDGAVRIMRIRRPNLLTVNHPFVDVSLQPRTQPGEVLTRSRL